MYEEKRPQKVRRQQSKSFSERFSGHYRVVQDASGDIHECGGLFTKCFAPKSPQKSRGFACERSHNFA